MNVVVQFFPEALDVNGDAQNALVLAQRAAWSGRPTEVHVVGLADRPGRIDPVAVVIGSGVDSASDPVRRGLSAWAERLQGWADAGVPILAVGTGFELLADDGLGLLPGRAVARPERSTGDLVVDSEFGRLVGFENHARGFALPSDATPLGSVVHGVGNDLRTEGARSGTVWGTHLHGPVLAKNPDLADAILRIAFGADFDARDERIRFVDALARSAREAVTERLELSSAP